MLTHLRVKNIALMDDIALDFGEGLNIFTGETGAGKSMILGAVKLALGGRVSKELLRQGDQRSEVSLVFDLTGSPVRNRLEQEGFPCPDGELILSRYIAPNGRAVNRLNDDLVTGAQLQKIASCLIDLHGQHEHQSLLDASKHIDLLDRFDERISAERGVLRSLLEQYKELNTQYQKWAGQAKDKDRILALMQYEAGEIDQASIVEGEEEELLEKTKLARNAVRISEHLSAASGALNDENSSAAMAISDACAQLKAVSDLDSAVFSAMISSLSEASMLLAEVCSDIRRYQDQLTQDPEELAAMEERLSLIGRLKSRYGAGFEQIRAYREKLEESIRKIENINETLSSLEEQMRGLYDQMEVSCQRLTALRRETAQKVENRITEILKTLQFQDPDFRVQITAKDTIGVKGKDTVQFLIRTNIGQEHMPLDKIASGGEISRIMLAIKTVLADLDEIPTLIFDEIDSGISGRTAQSVAEKLAMISKYHQVIAISHLPQIAAMADQHFYIEKTAIEGHARTQVQLLSEEDSAEELARMLGGVQLTEAARMNARDLKKAAQDWKKRI